MSSVNAGGTPNDIQTAIDADYRSTTAVAQLMGLPGLSVAWIIDVLGVKPALYLRNGGAVYWAPGQVAEIRRAVILHLLQQEFQS